MCRQCQEIPRTVAYHATRAQTHFRGATTRGIESNLTSTNLTSEKKGQNVEMKCISSTKRTAYMLEPRRHPPPHRCFMKVSPCWLSRAVMLLPWKSNDSSPLHGGTARQNPRGRSNAYTHTHIRGNPRIVGEQVVSWFGGRPLAACMPCRACHAFFLIHEKMSRLVSAFSSILQYTSETLFGLLCGEFCAVQHRARRRTDRDDRNDPWRHERRALLDLHV